MSFLELLSHYPGFVPSALIGALLVFWLLAILGLVDFEHFGPDLDLPDDGGGEHAEAPGTLMALGLDKLSFSIVISGIVFFWWVLTLLGVALLGPWIPLPGWISGTVLLAGALVLALPLAARALRPLKPLFVVHASANRETIIGRSCRILTLKVDEDFGQAEVVIDAGAPLNVRVCADVPNTLTRGSTALIIEIDERSGRYRVEAWEPPPMP